MRLVPIFSVRRMVPPSPTATARLELPAKATLVKGRSVFVGRLAQVWPPSEVTMSVPSPPTATPVRASAKATE